MKPIDISRQLYSMKAADGKHADVTLYGDVVDTVPVDWWTGEPIPGDYIQQDAFLADLDSLKKCKSVTFHLNSYGGDSVVGMLIHNKIREMSAAGIETTCIVDAVAMSAGSIIMCACDNVVVNPAALVMIHRCWALMFGGYNADELRKMAESQDAYDRAYAAAYKRKTGLSETVIMHMMSETTYMTGAEAVEKGFADELLDAAPVKLAASADGRSIFAGQHEIHLAPGMFAPDILPEVSQEETHTETPEPAEEAEDDDTALPFCADKDIKPEAEGTTAEESERKEEEEAMCSTIEELREQYPDLCEQMVSEAVASASADAVKAERERMQGIDVLASMFDQTLVSEARYGETACDAKELTYRAALQAAEQGKEFLSNLAADAQASGAQEVPAAVPAEEIAPQAMTEDQKRAALRQILHPEK